MEWIYILQQKQTCNFAWKQVINLQLIQFYLIRQNNPLLRHQKQDLQIKVPAAATLIKVVAQKIILRDQAIAKAKKFGFDLNDAVMASDAFFPFPDCVEIACKAGIKAVIQPGGSVKDNESIDYCNAHNIAMVLTGIRHFRH